MIGRNITWWHVADALDTFIGTLLQNMAEESDAQGYWRQELIIAMAKKHEAMMLARQEERAWIPSK